MAKFSKQPWNLTTLMIILLIPIIKASSDDLAADNVVQALLDGVSSPYFWALPSMLNVYGSSAFAILTTVPVVELQQIPFIAASVVNPSGGKIVVSATDEIIEKALYYPSSAQILRNSIKWASGGNSNARVALHCSYPGIDRMLNASGFQTILTGRTVLDNPDELQNYDVFVTSFPVMPNGQIMMTGDVFVLQNFLQQEKGLVVANFGLNGEYKNSTFMRHDSLFNRLISPYGISLVPISMYFTVNPLTIIGNQTILNTVHATNAYNTLVSGVRSGIPVSQFTWQLVIFRNMLLTAPPNTQILTKFITFWDPTKFEMLASEDNPLIPSMAVVVDSAVLDFKMDEFDPSQIKAHPSSLSFPSLGFTEFGPAVMNKVVTITPDNRIPDPTVNNQNSFSTCFNFDIPALDRTEPYMAAINSLSDADTWYSTGSYVPPGVKIMVKFPATLNMSGIFIQIGSHTDNLFSVPQTSYTRYPKLVYQKYASKQTIMSSPFGGFLYIVLPPGSGLQPFELTIIGAVEMLPYVFETASHDDWAARSAAPQPAPWIELVNAQSFILTMPSSVAATAAASTLEQYLKYLGQVVNNELHVARYAKIIPSIRWVIDRQITNGGAHNG